MATTEQILEKITAILQDINTQFTDLAAHSDASNELKGDLFEATVNYFAAHVTIYNKLLKSEGSETPQSDDAVVFTPAINTEQEEAVHSQQVAEVRSPGANEVNEEEVVAREGAAEETSEAPDAVRIDHPDIEEREVEEDEVAKEDEQGSAADAEESNRPDAVTQPSDDAAEHTDVREVVQEVTIENKELQVDTGVGRPSRPLSLNERISAQRRAESSGGSLAHFGKRTDSERVTDIKSAISLNDKLLFIKDLFNGYSLAYSEAIELLNRYDDFASADAFLQENYAQKNNWADKPVAVDKLYAILRKRFG